MEQIRVGVISASGQNKVFLAEIGVILKKKFLLQGINLSVMPNKSTTPHQERLASIRQIKF